MSSRNSKAIFQFRGSQKPPLVASRDSGPFCRFTTQTSGTPTVQASSSGCIELALDATSEVQNACLYQGDVLPFNIDDLIRIEFLAKLSSGALNAAVTGAFGLASARNDALASITTAALFRFAGGSANSMVLDARDGTNSQASIATGEVPSTTYRRFAIDFSGPGKTQSPPSLSKGGKADVRFFMSDANNVLKQVGKATNFDMSAYSSGLQIFAQIQKTTGTATGTLSISHIEVDFRLPA